MNHLKRMLFVVAVGVLGLLGASSAFAQCTTANITSTSPQVRNEATVELVGTVTVTCTAGSLGTAVQASISLTLNPASTVFVATSTTPDNMSTFPRPVITECSAGTAAGNLANPGTCVGAGAAPSNITVIGSGTNSLTFTFTGSTGTDTVVSIAGIRANINASGLSAGQALTATGVTGGAISATTNTLIVGVVNNGLTSTGTNPTGITVGNTGAALPLNIAACGPIVNPPTSSSATTTVPDGSKSKGLDFTGASSLMFTFHEGFQNAWRGSADVAGGAITAGEPDAVAAPQGTRFRIVLSGIPTGVSVWAPEQISGGPGAGASAGFTGTASVGAAFTLVNSANSDGSGGTKIAVPVLNQFDKITVSSGTATIVYEAQFTDQTASETVQIHIDLAGNATLGVGTITGSLGFAPVGPPTAAAWRPQFAAATSKTVANVAVCATYILFPWVAYDAKGGLDTGFAVSNTTSDPAVIGTTNQAGAVTMYFFAQNGGPNPAPVPLTPPTTGAKAGDNLLAGQTATYVLSQLTPGTPFYGYAIAVCNFQMGHAFAFFNNPQPGTGGSFAEGYLGVIITNPRLGPAISAAELGGR